jgi:cystathionine beta-synthase
LQIRDNILDAIGNTPIVRLNKVSRGIQGELLAKCEFFNPGGSIKDRIGRTLIEEAERKGLLKPGGTIVEATSGNTGMGLAITAAVKGYNCIFVLPDKMSEEKRQNLRAFGARVVITPTGVPPESPLSHYSVAERLARETPNAYYTSQYHNTDNRDTHYRTTGPEIWNQTDGRIDAIVAGMGTCGTIAGIGRYMKEKNPKIKIIGIDPKGSILKDVFETGKVKEMHSYKMEGIGEDMIPGNNDFSVVDEIVRVEDPESHVMTRQLLTKEGLFVGVSAGAAVVGAMRWMSAQAKPQRVLVILPDSGNRYLSKVFNDAWMIENGYLARRKDATIGEMMRMLNKNRKMMVAQWDDTVDSVVRRMRDEGISQLPVFRDDAVCGIVEERALLRPLIEGTVKPSDSVQSVADKNYAMVQDTDPVERLTDIFSAEKVALVCEAGRVTQIVTKIDLISYLSLQAGVAVSNGN